MGNIGRVKLAGLIFDLDGLLVDSESLQLRAEASALAQFGVRPESEDIALTTGRTITDWAKYYIGQYGLRVSPDSLIRKRDKILFGQFWEKMCPMPGAEKALKLGQSLDYKIALASSNYRKYIEHVLQKFVWDKYFQAVVGEEDVRRGKPEPDLFLLAAGRLGLRAQQCLVFEDSVNGLRAAQAAGMLCVIVGGNFGQEFTGAQRRIESLVEIDKKFLEEL